MEAARRGSGAIRLSARRRAMWMAPMGIGAVQAKMAGKGVGKRHPAIERLRFPFAACAARGRVLRNPQPPHAMLELATSIRCGSPAAQNPPTVVSRGIAAAIVTLACCSHSHRRETAKRSHSHRLLGA